MQEITKTAYKKSIELLENLSTDVGFLASTNNTENYKRIWARDGVVVGIASLIGGDKKLIKTFEKHLNTLEKFQDETGRIPSNISKNSKTHVSYGTTVGRIDATIWYIVGVNQFVLRTKDKNFFKKHKKSVDKALFYLKCVELNGKGLLYIPQGGDWADEYINSGYVLFDQVLYFLALDGYYKITKDKEILKKKNKLKKLIKINYLPKKENLGNPLVYKKILFENSLKSCNSEFPIPTFTASKVFVHIDIFANSLLVLSGILDKKESKEIIEATKKKLLEKNYFPIIPAFHPIIKKGNPNWDILKNNYLFRFRNKPNQYENGGLWPLVTGFFYASSSEEKSERIKNLTAFAQVLERDNFIFPEFYHGLRRKPMGISNLGFSASAYVIAYNSIINNKKVFI